MNTPTKQPNMAPPIKIAILIKVSASTVLPPCSKMFTDCKEILKKSFPDLLSDNVHYASSTLEIAPLLSEVGSIAAGAFQTLLKKAAIDEVLQLLNLSRI